MNVETIAAICLGIGLSAACGFRIFIPLLATSVAAHTGNFNLPPDADWIGSTPALVVFAIATVVEVGAYYLPWVDNALDTVATPGAIAVGTLAMKALLPESDPLVNWSIAAIAGGGTAGIVQGFTDATRLTSTTTTGGLGNPLVSTMELLSATVLSLLALAVPFLAAFIVLGVLVVAIRKIWQWLFRSR